MRCQDFPVQPLMPLDSCPCIEGKLLCNQPYSNHIAELIPCYYQYFHQKEWERFLYTKKSNFPLH